MRPPPDDFFEMFRLGAGVNKVANDGPEIQEPFDPASEPVSAPKSAMRSRRGGPDDAQGSLF